MVNSFTNCEWLASAFQGCIFRLNRNGVYKGAERSVKGAIVRIAAQRIDGEHPCAECEGRKMRSSGGSE